MKNLKTIQTIAKIARVISIIVFVCSIIGAGGCLIGILTLGLLGNSEFMAIILEEVQMDFTSSILSSISGLIWCVAEIIVSYMAMKYFKRELEVGTPFTFDGASELFRVGLLGIIVPLAASIIDGIMFFIVALIDPQIPEEIFSSSVDIGFGIAVIVVAILCKHGAELAEKIHQNAENTQSQAEPATNSEEFSIENQEIQN